MSDPAPMYHLDPIFTRDRAAVPEEAMSLAYAEQKRRELRARGIETRRPLKVGTSPVRDNNGERKMPHGKMGLSRPVQRWEVGDE